MLWADSVIVLLHACTDRSEDIVNEISAENPGRIHIIVEPDPVWREMSHRQRLLDEARKHGATHLGCVDADEVISGNLLAKIREQISCLPPGAKLQMRRPNLWDSINQYAIDAPSKQGRFFANWANEQMTVAVADHPALTWKAQNGYDHHQRDPQGSRPGAFMQELGLMHLQFANRRRLIEKHRSYQIEEKLRWGHQKSDAEIKALYSLAIRPQYARLAPVPASWWEPYRDILHYLDLEAEPWQTRENVRAIAQHGREKFAGLDLFEDLLTEWPEEVLV